MPKIKVKDLTTLKDVAKFAHELAETTGKGLKALSDNDQVILAQTKDALENIMEKIILLDRKLNLLSDIFENLLIGPQNEPLEKISIDQYKELVLKFK